MACGAGAVAGGGTVGNLTPWPRGGEAVARGLRPGRGLDVAGTRLGRDWDTTGTRLGRDWDATGTRRSGSETCSAPAALVSSRRRRHDGARRPQVSPASARASDPLLTVFQKTADKHPRGGERGAAHAPGAGVCRQAQPGWRSVGDIRVSRGPEGRGERPATGRGQPRAAQHADPHRLRDWASWRSERPVTGRGQPRAAQHADPHRSRDWAS
jgi:hypothetical protein